MAQVYDFDRVIGRRGTDSIKFDFAVQMGKPADALPMWVADMDFQSPPGVLEALARRVDHGIFGYTDAMADYDAAVTGWFERRFGWRPDAQWMIRTPGVVNALAMIVRALTAPGDAVLVQPPVYYPFFNVIRKNGRRVVENPLVRRDDGHYEIDFDGFEAAIAENGVKLFILCSPHNPVGRVWTAAELRRMGEICLAHGVYVASDEIHCDFTYPGHPHTPFIAAVPEMAERTVVCTAPSKTFNLAGLQASNNWAPGEDVRARVEAQIAAAGASGPNCLGLAACKAAYLTGEDWLDSLLGYLAGNIAFMRDFLRSELPMLGFVEPEGTYLAWVDFSALGLSDDALEDLIANRAKLWLDDGSIFGTGGAQFQRFVLACPRPTLERALAQLKRAIRP